MYAHLFQFSFVVFFEADFFQKFHSLRPWCKVGWLSCFLCFVVISLLCLVSASSFSSSFLLWLMFYCFVWIICRKYAEEIKAKKKEEERERERKSQRQIKLYCSYLWHRTSTTYLWSGRNRCMDYMTFGWVTIGFICEVRVDASSFFYSSHFESNSPAMKHI